MIAVGSVRRLWCVVGSEDKLGVIVCIMTVIFRIIHYVSEVSKILFLEDYLYMYFGVKH